MRIMTTLLLSAALLAGCASIPLSTMARMSSFDERSLIQLDPAQIRVRVAVPVGFEVDIEKTKLEIDLHDEAGNKRHGEFALSRLATTRSQRPGGFLRADVAANQYDLALTPESMKRLRELQAYAASHALKSYEMRVGAELGKVPEDAKALRFWADVKLSDRDAYMTLFDGAEIVLKRS